ncbi:hypothetical protein IE81DRAFT_363580 [Ceraceosorus guamensis]|uniref:Uncharacterized protein n=1 Tax=Ceraceosorus guamensis TaxID=1522189 RepID=A0A316WB11_9BASI|nr:hypothetical protein IE81DRAFT_363580 [Ceraceosorus guamensis]PWN46168.1 hypothetical protein IE81DRAFT_363580 [Ceraceosorus guamensis]
MADALDDDEYLDRASTSPSPAVEGATLDVGFDQDEAGPRSADEARAALSSKRKRSADADGEDMDEVAKKAKKKQKQKARDKARKAQRNEVRSEMTALGGPGRLPCDLQADYLRKVMRKCKFLENQSDLELNEVAIGQQELVETTDFVEERTDDALVEFIRAVSPSTAATLDNLQPHEVQAAQPVCLVVTGNAMRAADLCRSLRAFLGSRTGPEEKSQESSGAGQKQKSNKPAKKQEASSKVERGKLTVAKLFARHFKLKEHVEWLKDNKIPLAAGTPQRLRALLEAENPHSAESEPTSALDLSKLQLLVLDVTWRDEKERGLLEGFETRDETVRLLICDQLRSKIAQNVKIALF